MLFLKLLLAPMLILLVSLAARRWGHRVSGLLSALPVNGGPIFAVLIIEQGSEFGAQTAVGTLATVSATAVYFVVFVAAARRFGWLGCLLLGWAAYFAAALPLAQLPVDAHQGLALAMAGMILGAWVLPRQRGRAAPVRVPRMEIAFRMGAAVVLVFGISASAASLGPQYSGMLASFPIGTSVLPAFTRALHGYDATVMLVRGALLGMLAFPVFIYGLAVALPRLNAAIAFALALGAMLVVHGAVMVAVQRGWLR